MRAICTAHIILLDLMNVTILSGREIAGRLSACNVLHLLVAYSSLDPAF
jgi:hypothetical protein